MDHRKFKKQYGQNFLKNQRFAQEVVDALELWPEDIVIEVGPGKGMLTKLLLETGATVIAVEIDYDLLAGLVKRFHEYPNFKLVNEDFIKVKLEDILEKYGVEGSIKICGNLPFNASKKIIDKALNFHFYNQKYDISKMSFIVQDEVAKEYAASSPKATYLSTSVNLLADVKKLHSVPAAQFFPRPAVSGGILVITPRKDIKGDVQELKKFIKLGYSSPRKKLINNLENSNKYSREALNETFKDLDIPNNQRAAEMANEKWRELHNKLNNKKEK